jgi:hypothetical protein
MRDREDATNSIKLPRVRVAEYFDQKAFSTLGLDYVLLNRRVRKVAFELELSEDMRELIWSLRARHGRFA